MQGTGGEIMFFHNENCELIIVRQVFCPDNFVFWQQYNEDFERWNVTEYHNIFKEWKYKIANRKVMVEKCQKILNNNFLNV